MEKDILADHRLYLYVNGTFASCFRRLNAIYNACYEGVVYAEKVVAG
ncbi:hypothetical protein [Chryseobacterium sp. CP-77]